MRTVGEWRAECTEFAIVGGFFFAVMVAILILERLSR